MSVFNYNGGNGIIFLRKIGPYKYRFSDLIVSIPVSRRARLQGLTVQVFSFDGHMIYFDADRSKILLF
jgi:hypothetical protein